jgi:hypothetical protein
MSRFQKPTNERFCSLGPCKKMVVGGYFRHDNNHRTTTTLCILPQNPTCLNVDPYPI